MSDQGSFIEVRDLKVQFLAHEQFTAAAKRSRVRAVDGVSFSIQKGEVLGLVGESGCGKSTISRAILQLIPINSGEIYFDGQNLCKLNEKQMRRIRRRIQIIFQDYLLAQDYSGAIHI